MKATILMRMGGAWIFGSMFLGVFVHAGVATAQTSYTCPKLTVTLSINSRGLQVTQLQTYLRDTGDLPGGNSAITGFFGSVTESAVKRFQCRLGIMCTGNRYTTGYGAVGPRTRVAIAECQGLVLPNAAKPVVFLTASSTIPRGASTVLTWSVTAATSCVFENADASLAGSKIVSPLATTTYTLVCANAPAGYIPAYATTTKTIGVYAMSTTTVGGLATSTASVSTGSTTQVIPTPVNKVETLQRLFDATYTQYRIVLLSGVATTSVDGYNHAPAIAGLVGMFQATGNVAYIHDAIAIARTYIDAGKDVNSDGFKDWYSPWIGGYNHGHVEWRAAEGIAILVSVLYSDSRLSAERTEAGSGLVSFLEHDVWEKWAFAQKPVSEGDVTHFIGRQGIIALGLYKATKKGIYYDFLIQRTQWLKSHLILQPNGSYNWYCYMKSDCGAGSGTIDVAHAGDTVSFMLRAYEAGIVFTSQDVDRLTRTLLDNLWNKNTTTPAFKEYVNGSGNYGGNGAYLGGWIGAAYPDTTVRNVLYTWASQHQAGIFPTAFEALWAYGSLASLVK